MVLNATAALVNLVTYETQADLMQIDSQVRENLEQIATELQALLNRGNANDQDFLMTWFILFCPQLFEKATEIKFIVRYKKQLSRAGFKMELE